MKLTVLEGPNFSGRTRRLRSWVGLPNEQDTEPTCNRCVYIGPDASSALSGIAPTVEAEFILMAADNGAVFESKKALADLGFDYCMNQNPFTLSGGEQVVVAIVAAAATRPKRMAIDCALEQLSTETRSNLLAYLFHLDMEITVADNRDNEWHFDSTESLIADSDAPSIHPHIDLKIAQNPCEIELLNLCHHYVKGREVLHNLNFKFASGVTYQLKGPNGSGKTTLSKILCGIIKPTSGEIRINGKAVQPWKNPGKFVSYHFQNPDYQLFATSVRAQLLNPISNNNMLVPWFGLEKHLDDHPLDLPFVLKKRVALATAISRQSGFLVLDEPTLGQDRINSKYLVNFFANNISGYIISHSQLFADLPIIELSKR